jgi:hypothetical protein
MIQDDELQALQNVWRQEGSADTSSLRRRVRRETHLIWLSVAVELLVSAVALAGSMWLAVSNPEPEFVVLTIGVWMLTVTALIYSWWNREGTWKPAQEDTREFLRLSLRRCESGLRSIRLALNLLAIQTALLIVWFAWYWSSRTPRPDVATWLIAACVPGGFLIGLLVMRRRRLREQAELQRMQHELFD